MSRKVSFEFGFLDGSGGSSETSHCPGDEAKTRRAGENERLPFHGVTHSKRVTFVAFPQ